MSRRSSRCRAARLAGVHQDEIRLRRENFLDCTVVHRHGQRASVVVAQAGIAGQRRDRDDAVIGDQFRNSIESVHKFKDAIRAGDRVAASTTR